MPSLEEAQFISGLDSPEENARFFMGLGADTCIFKCGEKGSYIKTRDSSFTIPAYQVQVSDTGVIDLETTLTFMNSATILT